jgi:hypothetical protein
VAWLLADAGPLPSLLLLSALGISNVLITARLWQLRRLQLSA